MSVHVDLYGVQIVVVIVVEQEAWAGRIQPVLAEAVRGPERSVLYISVVADSAADALQVQAGLSVRLVLVYEEVREHLTLSLESRETDLKQR